MCEVGGFGLYVFEEHGGMPCHVLGLKNVFFNCEGDSSGNSLFSSSSSFFFVHVLGYRGSYFSSSL